MIVSTTPDRCSNVSDAGGDIGDPGDGTDGDGDDGADDGAGGRGGGRGREVDFIVDSRRPSLTAAAVHALRFSR